MVSRFDLTRVELRDYRSIARCDVELGPLTFLVGPNGSGKSNFLDALRFTAQALSENLDNAVRDRGGIREIIRKTIGRLIRPSDLRKPRPAGFEVLLEFRGGTLTGRYSFGLSRSQGDEFGVSWERCYVEVAGSSSAYFTVKHGQLAESSEQVMPPASPGRLYLVVAAGVDAFRPVFDGLSTINVYNVNPAEMRRPQQPDAGELLRRDGANLASVLARLRRNRPEVVDRIEEYLGQVVPGITRVDQIGYGGWDALEFVQGDQGRRFPGSSMSDGTLRALGVLAALFSGDPETLSPVGIEEPEVALHPGAAGLLLDALRDAAEHRQVLVTTHSPDLLDSPDLAVEDILAVRADTGTTTIGRVDRAGRRALRDHLFTPGELLRADQLAPEPPPAESTR